MGGMVAAVERGYPQREIVEASFHFQQQVEEKEKIVVGVNKYVDSGEAKIPVLAIDPEVERKQIERIVETRRTRDAGRWREAMDELRRAASAPSGGRRGEAPAMKPPRGGRGEAPAMNELMPAFVDCARAMATVGEQVQVLKEAYGEYHDPGYF